MGSVCAAGFVVYTLYSDGYFNKEKIEEYTEKLKKKNTQEIQFDPNVLSEKFPNIINNSTKSNSIKSNESAGLNSSGTEKTLGRQSITSSQIIKNGVIHFNQGTSPVSKDIRIYTEVSESERIDLIEEDQDCHLCLIHFSDDGHKIVESDLE